MPLPFLKSNKVQNTQDFVLIISAEEKNLITLSEYLCLKGIGNLKTICKNPQEIAPSDIKWGINAVILDAQDITDIQGYCDLIERIFPKEIPCVILANNDSIKIHQAFLSRGIFYLNWESQYEEIYEKIFNFSENIQNKKSIKISVLGTKGGCGNSFLTHQIAKIIHKKFKSMILNVQGSESSFNLDLLSGINFEKEYDEKNNISLYRESKEEAYNYHNLKHFKFNFILYDHAIQGVPKETIEIILNESDNIILTLTDDIDSIRKAKEVLRINEFLLSVHRGCKRIYICQNHNHPHSKNSFCSADIAELLEAKIDILIPYQKMDKTKPSTPAKSKTLTALELLVNKLMGTPEKKGKKWF